MTKEQVNKLEEGDLIRYKGIPWQFEHRCTTNDALVVISSLRNANSIFVPMSQIEEFEPFESTYFTAIR